MAKKVAKKVVKKADPVAKSTVLTRTARKAKEVAEAAKSAAAAKTGKTATPKKTLKLVAAKPAMTKAEKQKKLQASWSSDQWREYALALQKEKADAETSESEEEEEEEDDDGAESETSGEPTPPPKKKSTSKYEMRAKLCPPKHAFDGREGDYDMWAARSVDIWRRKYGDAATDDQLGAELVEALSGEALTAVFALIKEGREGFDDVMKTLAARFGRRTVPKMLEASRLLAKCTRSRGQTLREFLGLYSQRRSRAEQLGEQFCEKTSGVRLLECAELAATQQAQIMSNLTMGRKGGLDRMPTYEDVRDQLEVLAQTLEARDQREGGKKKDQTALLGLEQEEKKTKRPKGGGKGGRGGKGGKDKQGGGGGAGSCYNCGKPGHFARECKSAPQGAGGKGVGKGKGKGKGKGGKVDLPCWYHDRGEKCPYGAECRFTHGVKDGKGSGGDPPAKRPKLGDD